MKTKITRWGDGCVNYQDGGSLFTMYLSMCVSTYMSNHQKVSLKHLTIFYVNNASTKLKFLKKTLGPLYSLLTVERNTIQAEGSAPISQGLFLSHRGLVRRLWRRAPLPWSHFCSWVVYREPLWHSASWPCPSWSHRPSGMASGRHCHSTCHPGWSGHSPHLGPAHVHPSHLAGLDSSSGSWSCSLSHPPISRLL